MKDNHLIIPCIFSPCPNYSPLDNYNYRNPNSERYVWLRCAYFHACPSFAYRSDPTGNYLDTIKPAKGEEEKEKKKKTSYKDKASVNLCARYIVLVSPLPRFSR